MKEKKMHSMHDNRGQIALHIIFVLLMLAYFIPVLTVISTSFMSDKQVQAHGSRILPNIMNLDFSAYQLMFHRDAAQIVRSYGVTIFITVTFVVLDTTLALMLAYPLSRLKYKFNKALAVYLLISMLVAGNMIPEYILISRYLKMKDTIWVYIIPNLIAPYKVLVIRTAYRSIPEELYDAARIDGASELFVCFRIAIPLIKPTIAYLAFTAAVSQWNEWVKARFYIRDSKLWTLQYLLQKTLLDYQAIKNMQNNPMVAKFMQTISTSAYQFAMALVCAGPMLFVFPYFQKYFTKGIMVGSLKG